MAVNIPNSILRTFVSVVDARTMIDASEQVFLSQSAISYQIKKLEDIVKHPLFYRSGKRLLLTEAGQMLYEYSRRILRLHDEVLSAISVNSITRPVRIGMVQDFSDSFLKEILKRYHSRHACPQVYIKVARTVHLKRLISEGELDVAVGFGSVEDREVVAAKQTYWFGNQKLLNEPVVPLALLEHPCKFRDAVLTTFQQAGRAYRITVEAPNLSALRATVDAGIGLTCRTTLFGDDLLESLDSSFPELPKVGFCLYMGESISTDATHLSEIIRDLILDLK